MVVCFACKAKAVKENLVLVHRLSMPSPYVNDSSEFLQYIEKCAERILVRWWTWERRVDLWIGILSIFIWTIFTPGSPYGTPTKSPAKTKKQAGGREAWLTALQNGGGMILTSFTY